MLSASGNGLEAAVSAWAWAQTGAPKKFLLHTACKIERHPAMRRSQISPRIAQWIAARAGPRSAESLSGTRASLHQAPIADRRGASGYVCVQQIGDRLGVTVDAPEAQGRAQLRTPEIAAPNCQAD